ncbi:MAG TPA: lipopolysaccharide assembly protein LapA domain-containing protein [Woeseiaceae bacterium]|nr:lipopolysaccharide assembly protein LapA domain-containing protein [Woeseiaceae bacterium]
MLKRIGAVLLILIILAAMLVFTRLNPGLIEIDLAFGTVESSIPLAFTVAFAAGWLFGLLCTAAFVTKLLNERRRLRRELRSSETELSSLRHIPLSDAD